MKFWKKEQGKKIGGFIKRHKVSAALAALLVIGAAVFLFLGLRPGKKEAAPQLPPVETAAVERMDLTNSISVTGTLASAKGKSVNTSLTNMEVTKVYVEVGDAVQEGDLICSFDSSDIEEALADAENNYSVNQKLEALDGNYQEQYQETLQKAEDTLQAYRNTRDNAKETYSRASEAEAKALEKYEAVKAAYDLGALEKASQAAKEEARKAAQAYEDSKTDEKGNQTGSPVNSLEEYLAKWGENSAEYEAIKSQVEAYNKAKKAQEDAQAAIGAAQTEYKNAQSETAKAYSSYTQAQEQRENYQETYEDTLDQAEKDYQKNLLNNQLVSENSDLKKIESYKEQLEDCLVYAAMSGTITALNVEEGNVFEGGIIYEVQDTDHFIVEASVDEYDIVNISKGQKAYVKTSSTGGEELEGEVTFVAATGSAGTAMGAGSSTASYQIQITINSQDQSLLRSGMTGSVSISLEESKDALAVPYDCIQENERGEKIVYVEENGERKKVVVETGIETDYYTEITGGGLTEGMTVYLANPLTQFEGSSERVERRQENGAFNMGGGIPSGGPGGGGMPSGGGPGGF